MKKTRGDLLGLAASGKFDVIIHGCNCQNAMGKGIAKAVKQQFPAAYAADCQTTKGDSSKMGQISFANVQCDEEHELVVVNAYTQFHWRGPQSKVDYDALRSTFRHVKQQFSGKRIGYPLIGAGLGGGDWTAIAKIIDEELEGEDHTLVEFQA